MRLGPPVLPRRLAPVLPSPYSFAFLQQIKVSLGETLWFISPLRALTDYRLVSPLHQQQPNQSQPRP